jgi:hypothetical protein
MERGGWKRRIRYCSTECVLFLSHSFSSFLDAKTRFSQLDWLIQLNFIRSRDSQRIYMTGDASSAAQPALLEAEELQQEIEARIAEMLEESREAEQVERDQEALVEGVRLCFSFSHFAILEADHYGTPLYSLALLFYATPPPGNTFNMLMEPSFLPFLS